MLDPAAGTTVVAQAKYPGPSNVGDPGATRDRIAPGGNELIVSPPPAPSPAPEAHSASS